MALIGRPVECTYFFDIVVMSRDEGVGTIISTDGGSGLVTGTEMGQQMSWAEMIVTPLVGL